MTTLAVEELVTTLVQPLKVEKPVRLLAVKPWLYFHNMPSGTFTMALKKDSVTVREWQFTSANVRDAFGGTQQFFHVYLSLSGSPLIIKEGDYTLELSASGYTFGASWVGWCKDWQGVVGRVEGQAVDFTAYPYSFRILASKGREQ
jgi:hypothetical protein